MAERGGIRDVPPEVREAFVAKANQGMRSAQQKIVERVLMAPEPSASETILFRGVADSIAWQLLGNQLCHARRLYKEQVPPDLKHSNFESVVMAADHLVRKHPDAMPLISDLTSFVQVGDILASIPGQGMIISEVKEGSENKRIFDFMNFYNESKCETALKIFLEQSSQGSVKQLERMARQADRMAHFTEIMSVGISRDPDTNKTIRIPEQEIQIDTWDKELNELLANKDGKGWAIQVIDDCLFLGCYFDKKMVAAGHIAFNSWFDSCGGGNNFPRARLIDSMTIPLALPIFNRQISPERMFDLLFGRLQVCMAVNVESLLAKIQREGLRVRFGTNRETSRLEKMGGKLYRHNGNSIFIGNGKAEIGLADGIFLRILFHGQKPISLIQAILSNTSEGA